MVEYGADRYGFQPAGEGITVAPPTLIDESANEEPEEEEDAIFRSRAPVRPRPQPQPQLRARPRPQQSFHEDSYDVQTTFHPEPVPRPAPQAFRRPAASPARGPLPQRPAAFSGAIPQGGVEYSPRPRPNRPVPSPLELMQHAPRAGPGRSLPPQQPQPQPQPQYHQPAPQFQQSRPAVTGGILDQLAKDYALPQNSGVTTLHDISFGYY